jgi:octaprenyl-diphosphate synthase
MANILDQIKAPIRQELKEFEKHFKGAMKSHVPLLDKITYYIVQRKGKQVRPMFVFLSAQMFGPITEATFQAASLVELLHTASLVHDDVVDDSMQRRGFFSINALWKNKIAVLVGDYLLSKGLLLALDNDRIEMLKIISRAVKSLSEGELLQIEKARKLDIDEAVYFEIIKNKTASLIAASCAAGAASTASPEDVLKMHDFGEKIGIAFQIKDDLFDYGEEQIGKPKGIDIKEKKMTLPLIYTLSQIDRKERKSIIRTIRRHSDDRQQVNKIIATVKASGGIEYAQAAMLDYQQQAFDILYTMPDSESRQALEKLVRYITERRK